jgi:hypothetical protein
MTWGRRLLLLSAAGLFAVLLGLALSVALARPAGAATLPSLPVSTSATSDLGTATAAVPGLVGTVEDAASPVAIPADPTQVLSGVTSAASAIVPTTLPISQLPISPLPISQLPISPLPLPLPILPVITKAATDTLSPGANQTGTNAGGLLPGTGGPANGSTGRLSGPRSRRLGSPTGRSHTASVDSATRSLGRTPTGPAPSPSLPALPANAGDITAPGHGSNPWNALPLTILLLTVLVLGGVTLKRRLSLKLLFESRFAPPG